MQNVLRPSSSAPGWSSFLTTPSSSSSFSFFYRPLAWVLTVTVAIGSAVLASRVLSHHRARGDHEEDLFTVSGVAPVFVSNVVPRVEKKRAVKDTPGTAAEGKSSEAEARIKLLNLARALLRRAEDIELEETSSSSTPSDETDVSLNYHTATELEKSSRDELIEAFEEYRIRKMEAGAEPDQFETLFPRTSDPRATFQEIGFLLVKIVEYLDISNEREKLRIRYEAKQQAREAGGFERGAEATPAFPSPTAGASAGRLLNTLDHLLAQRRAQEERFEERWSGDDEHVSALMEYLRQDDAAEQFLSLPQMRQDRQRANALASVEDDVRVVGPNGEDFNEMLPAMDSDRGHRRWCKDEAPGDSPGLMPSEELMNQLLHDSVKGRGCDRRRINATSDEFGSDDDDLFDEDSNEGLYNAERRSASAWNSEEKAFFEQELAEYLQIFADSLGVTELVSEQEAMQHEAEETQRRERRLRRVPEVPSAAGDEDAADEWEDTEEEEELS